MFFVVIKKKCEKIALFWCVLFLLRCSVKKKTNGCFFIIDGEKKERDRKERDREQRIKKRR